MSLHYEWTLSLWLRRDVPDAFLEELRYHLGLTGQAPENPILDHLGPALFTGAEDGDELPGGQFVRLMRQEHGRGFPVWGLFVRAFVLDDVMYDLIQILPPWLAQWAGTEGWIGFAREELSLDVWLNFYAAQGHAYAAPPGEEPQPLSEGAPPFTARHTSDDLALHPREDRRPKRTGPAPP